MWRAIKSILIRPTSILFNTFSISMTSTNTPSQPGLLANATANRRSPKVSPGRLQIESFFKSKDAASDGYSVDELALHLPLKKRFVSNTVGTLLRNLEISLAGKDANGKQRYKHRETIVCERSASSPIRNSNRPTGSPAFWDGYFGRMSTPRANAGMPSA